ncbi:ImmA/IrrE family metallo-endopeptidase [Alkalihalobacillus sp. LMS39]|uniref:ImmA/IrrE family metallo-endopeptidase n=1 Tax=Alkalihalobacillus sp. LMS39 TaxID=2924032 RepID=UPI001FB39D35|nr:ImmA/IrrE family metallo-endopeptidase [Alkalihalobacillus sp. LMS39]UOE96042.1 ImmA/IrrE family metallo-endopeptidase [Alkalihalobacillus sp. LMS39]
MRFATIREEKLIKIYKNKDILTISDLSIKNMAACFNIKVTFHKKKSFCLYDNNCAFIFLNEDQSIEHIRSDFFHELAHFLEHSGVQKGMHKDFKKLQEEQAYWISLYAAMPRHIFEPALTQATSPIQLSELFQLPLDMVKERFNGFKRERKRHHEHVQFVNDYEKNRRKSLQPGKVYDSTIDILKKLANQVGEENLHHDVARLLRR